MTHTAFTAVYYLGLSLLMTHELDAVRASEWKLLYVLRQLEDAKAFAWFVAIHVPLFFSILWLSHCPNRRVRWWFRAGAAGFLIVHAGLHWRLSADPAYAFAGTLSNVLIYGAGAAGLAFLLLVLSQRFDRTR